jgi:hypothetical protein
VGECADPASGRRAARPGTGSASATRTGSSAATGRSDRPRMAEDPCAPRPRWRRGAQGWL